MLEEGFKNAGIGHGEFFVSLRHQSSIGGRRISANVPTESPLTAHGSIHVEFGDMNGKAERFHFREALIHGVEGHGDIDVSLCADGPDGHLFILQSLDEGDQFFPLRRILQTVVVVAEDGVGIRLVGKLERLFNEVRPDDDRPRRLAQDFLSIVGNRLVHQPRL